MQSLPVRRIPRLSPFAAVRRLCLHAGLAGALACAAAPSLAAQQGQAQDYQPEVGQPGKDVIWVPTPDVLVEKMLDMAKVSPQDRLMDLGSGDGRTVIAAARRGLTAKGIEYNADMVALARRRAEQAQVADRATFEQADLFETDLSQADVITMYLLPTINEKLAPKLLDLAPGTRIVSHAFGIGDWEPDQTERVNDDCPGYCTAFLWVVPAKVQGRWSMQGQPLVLEQRYQLLTGTLDGKLLAQGRLAGDQISFEVDGVRYGGTVRGDRIEGTVPADGSRPWTAQRQ
ncbi:class I SAM-dependent methyltransferase [Orrella sp. JC864]|uniref:SAM-dependent methyltransferase n=1 Tax=Orrella sp. JC864 TaxID=3120298 RepID=UPI003009DC7B